MNSEDSNGAAEAKDFEEILSEPLESSQMSARMKHLLFGVRLSAGLADLAPANDLEQLASQLDAMRAARLAKSRPRCSR